jgi:hypothetical protein
MDVWHAHIARLQRPDAVEHWARLEAKSETMCADLVRAHSEPAIESKKKSLAAGVFFEGLLIAANAVLHIYRR